MLISLRDRDKKLVVKDILDIDFDMSVGRDNNKYYVNVNNKYQLNEEFCNEKDAEASMIKIADARNNLENELKNY